MDENWGFRACVRTPFQNSVPQGRLKTDRDAILDKHQPSLRDSIRKSWFSHGIPRHSLFASDSCKGRAVESHISRKTSEMWGTQGISAKRDPETLVISADLTLASLGHV